MVKRYDASYGESVIMDTHGDYVTYTDYQSLQAALKEALDGWEEWNGSKEDADRIEFLRKQFDLTL